MVLASYALDGFAFAAEALVGQAVGAGSVVAMRRAAWRASLWAFAGGLLLAAAFWVAGPWVIGVMTPVAAVQAEALAALPFVVTLALIGVGAYMLDGIFIGATGTREMRNTVILAVAIYGAVIWAFVPAFGNPALWGALMVLNVLRAVFLGALYPRLEARTKAGGAAPS
jgi:MATE family multidrug resistance protein